MGLGAGFWSRLKLSIEVVFLLMSCAILEGVTLEVLFEGWTITGTCKTTTRDTHLVAFHTSLHFVHYFHLSYHLIFIYLGIPFKVFDFFAKKSALSKKSVIFNFFARCNTLFRLLC